MQWLLHGSLTPAAAEALRRHEQTAHSLEEVALANDASPADVLKAAHAKQWEIITTESSISDAPYEIDQRFNRCIVHLVVPAGDVEQDDAIDRLFERYKRLTPGRLYTVTASRVKVRQLKTQRLG